MPWKRERACFTQVVEVCSMLAALICAAQSDEVALWAGLRRHDQAGGAELFGAVAIMRGVE
jgi:hypothetical protein